jgi:2-dehydro-3-deoxygalactonokinase
MFELLSKHSFLRHSVAAEGGDLAGRGDFTLGVKRTAGGELPFLGAVFSVRARALLDRVDPVDNLAYLSGLVIGGEIAAARETGRLVPGSGIRIVGARSLGRAYARALEVVGQTARFSDGGELVAAGLLRLGRAARLIPERTGS